MADGWKTHAVQRVLGATSVHSSDLHFPRMARSLQALLDTYTALHVIVNHFDAGGTSETPVPTSAPYGHARMSKTSVAGMKPIFWKRVLTPERAAGFSLVWLFDADLAVHPSVLPFGAMVAAAMATGASAIQPSLRGGGNGASDVRATDHIHLQDSHLVHSSCLISTAKLVEVMTPVLRSDAWAAFHTEILLSIEDTALTASDFGIDVTWCSFFAHRFPRRPACVVHYGAPALHLNTESITRFMSKREKEAGRRCSATCRTLMSRFPMYFANYSHDTKRCWSGDGTGIVDTELVPGHDERGALHGVSRVRDADSAVWESDAKWLGAVDVPRSMGTTKLLTHMLISLRLLMNAHPPLRVVLNVQKRLDTDEFFNDVHSSDVRFRYTNFSISSAALLWKRVLTPARTRGLHVIWLFDPSLIVHPSVLPLGALVSALQTSDAGALVPAMHPVGRTPAVACAAKSTVAADTLCTLFDAKGRFGWSAFHYVVLGKMSDADLREADASVVLRAACPAMHWHATRRGRQTKATCVEVPSIGVVRSSRGARPFVSCAEGTGHKKTCGAVRNVLSERHGLFLESVKHDDGSCWDANHRWGLTRRSKGR